MTEVTRIYYFVFAALTFAGGLMGFVKKNSKASLISGIISGALLVAAGVMGGTNGGIILGLLVSLLLAGKFIPDYVVKKRLFPAGLMTLLSVVGTVLSIITLAKK